MQTLAQDLRYACRSIVGSPGVSIIAVLTLALGIGANTAIFSVVNGVILKPLGYHDPGELQFIQTGFPNIGFDEFWISAPEYLQYRDATEVFESMGAYNTAEVSLTGGGSPLRVSAGLATASLFSTLGVEAMLGRTFTDEEDSPAGPGVALLSYGLWNRAFGGREDALGETVTINGVPRTIVGVMPPRFDLDDNRIEIWLPLAWDEANPPNWGGHNFYAVGRLRDGVTADQAHAELDILIARWSAERPSAHSIRATIHEIQLQPLESRVVGDVRPLMLTMLGAVGFVLLIAVANVGNLLLARAELRQREIAVRAALGASRGRLIRQFVTESVVLSLTAGAVGLAAGTGALRLLLATNPESIPRLTEIELDPMVLLFTFAISVVTGLLFGLAPLLHLSADGLSRGLRDGSERSTSGAGRARLRQLIVVSEIAAAVVLVVGAGLMLRSFSTLLNVDPGFEASGALSFRLYLPPAAYRDPTDQVSFFERLRDELEATPGVERVSLMSGLPPARRINANTMEFENRVPTPEDPSTEVDYWQFVMDDYFETMRIPLREGRLFEPQDAGSGQPVALVNETMAQAYWPDGGALGRRVRTCCGDDNPWLTVVGVVGDVKQGGIDADTGTELYFYVPQVASTLGFAPRTMHVVARTTVPPDSLASAARATVWRLDPSLPLADLQTLETAIGRSVAQPRFVTVLLGSFGLIALLLAAVGTYGVMAVFVAERNREMGIRMALGAESGRVVGLVVRHGLSIAGAGLVVGLAGALALNRFVSAMLFDVGSTDPLTYAGVIVLLTVVAFLACVVPARRATRVDPMVALKG